MLTIKYAIALSIGMCKETCPIHKTQCDRGNHAPIVFHGHRDAAKTYSYWQWSDNGENLVTDAASVITGAVKGAPKKYCQSCGNEMSTDATFCSKCGQKN